MRIGVNARFLLEGKLEGIGLFTHEVMKRVVAYFPQHQFFFFFDRKPSTNFIYADNVTAVTVHPQARHPALWYWWFEQSIPRVLKKYKIDLFISTDGYLSLKTKVPTILTIHDLAFYHFKEHLPSLVHRYFNHYTPKFSERAKHIVTVSEFSKQDIMKQYGIEENKITVVGNGCDAAILPISENEKQSIKEKYTNHCDFFIYVGAIHPRKNIKRLLLAFDQFKRAHESKIKLVLVGRWAWKNSETKDVFDTLHYKDEVIKLGHLERSELGKVFGSALALIYPSLFEGFGIPLLEAMHAEIPIITSTSSSLPEVAGNAAIYIDPLHTDQLHKAMLKISTDEMLRQELIENAKINRKRYSWELTANKFCAIISKEL